MAFTEEVMDSYNRLMAFGDLQASMRKQKYSSGIGYFAFARSAQMVQDMFMKELQAGNIEAIQAELPNLLSTNFGVASSLIGKEGASAVVVVKEAIETLYKGLYDNWKAGIWHGVGSAYASAMEQFLGAGDLLWAYKHLMHRIAVTPKMARHWNAVYRPTVPNTGMAFSLWKKEFIKEKDFETLASYEGWPKKYIDKLKLSLGAYPSAHMAFRLMARGYMSEATYKKYVGYAGWPYFETKGWDEAFKVLYAWWPSAYEAFFMWKKGIIGIAERNKYYKGQGYPADLYEKITKNFEYLPTLYDLIRIADYQEVDLIWATSIMKKRGMNAKDIAKFIDYLRYRPLRDEVRDITRQLVWRYRFGRITPTALAAELAALPIGVTERALITDYAEMQYEDELITEQVFILKWQFRMAWITEAQYLAGLISLGFREEKANLMVEQEIAQGYFGYY